MSGWSVSLFPKNSKTVNLFRIMLDNGLVKTEQYQIYKEQYQIYKEQY